MKIEKLVHTKVFHFLIIFIGLILEFWGIKEYLNENLLFGKIIMLILLILLGLIILFFMVMLFKKFIKGDLNEK